MKILIVSLLFLSAHALSAVCADFKDQAEAQRYHESQNGNTRLDRDKDGEACECLPGGSAYGNPKCRNK